MQAPVLSTTNARRRRKESSKKMSPNITHASGWDHPPTVASPASLDGYNENFGTWNPRLCHWKTPQRLFTLDPSKNSNQDDEKQQKAFTPGNLFCAPIVVFKKYILVASDMNLSLYGDFDCQGQHEDPMQKRIATTAIPPLTKFSLSADTDGSFDFGDKIYYMSFHEESNIVYVLTVESCIFQIKLHIDEVTTRWQNSEPDTTPKTDLGSRNRGSLSDDNKGDSRSTPTTIQPPKFSLMCSWVTKRLGVTCMATLNDGGGIGIDTVCLGYRSGHIEGWNVHRSHSLDPKHTSQQRGRYARKDRGQKFSLDWEGILRDPIRTLSFLTRCIGEPQTEENTEADTSGKPGTTASPGIGKSEIQGKAKDQYLMVIVSISTRLGDKGKQQPTSSMLRILDMRRIMEQTKNKTNHSHADRSLERYLMPQSRGMKLVEPTTMSLSKDCRLPKRVPNLDSHGADAACILKYAGSADNNNYGPSCTGITFPDGVVCLFSSTIGEKYEAVGIDQDDHEVLLSFPAIGNGQINIIDTNGKPSSYLATCLRGGTCYLIPISSNNDNNLEKESIATIPFPHDIEFDLSDIYVQAFTAGNLVVDEIDLPILVYAWPGAVIDVYACGLIDSKAPNSSRSEVVDDLNDVLVSRAERRCLQDLIDNESISLLSNVFDELRENSQNPLLEMEEWQELSKEIKAGKTLPASVLDITLDSLCSIEYQSLRRILLSLALVNE